MVAATDRRDSKTTPKHAKREGTTAVNQKQTSRQGWTKAAASATNSAPGVSGGNKAADNSSRSITVTKGCSDATRDCLLAWMKSCQLHLDYLRLLKQFVMQEMIIGGGCDPTLSPTFRLSSSSNRMNGEQWQELLLAMGVPKESLYTICLEPL